jgi:hypothetical protein
MLDITKKQFMWTELGSGAFPGPTKGPYWTIDSWQVHGHRYYHSLDELEDMPLSKSVLKRLRSARPGTSIKAYSTGSYRGHYLTRMTDAEITKVNNLKSLEHERTTVRYLIEEATPDLTAREKDLNKLITKEKKKLKKEGLIR